MDALPTILGELHQASVIACPTPKVRELTGGVSSSILLLDDGRQPCILKRALPKLKVADDWQADVRRNLFEVRYLQYAAQRLPSHVPRVLYSDPQRGFFVMEYLGGTGWENWKQALLEGRADPAVAATMGRIIGTLHAASANDVHLADSFDTLENFSQLRLDPYLLTTARRHPDLAAELEAEASRLAGTAECLVHGDCSPKNLLTGPAGRVVLLDCEVAWYGDPAFDLAFAFNHFLLKSLVHYRRPQPMTDLIAAAWEPWCQAVGTTRSEAIAPRVARLLPMLLLARVDGKSPAEYLDPHWMPDAIRPFARKHILQPPQSVEVLTGEWLAHLEQFQT